MTRDRLKELRLHQNYQVDKNKHCTRTIQKFSCELEQLWTEVQSIRDNLNKMSSFANEMQQILSGQLHEKARCQLETLMANYRRTANNVRGQLKVMKQAIAQQQTLIAKSANCRIREIQYSVLSETFSTVINDYMQIQVDYKERRCNAKLEIDKKSAVEEEELEMLLPSDNSSIRDFIIVEMRQIEQTLDSNKVSHADFIHLEKSLHELHDLFTSINILVEQQGESKVNRIETYVKNAADYVQTGREELQQIARSRRKRQKRRAFIACTVLALVTVIVVLITIVLTFTEIPLKFTFNFKLI